MHLPRFLLHQPRHCSTTTKTTNKVSLYFTRATLINKIRLALRSTSPPPSILLPLLLTSQSLDSFTLTHSLNSSPSPSSALTLLSLLQTHNPNFVHSQMTLLSFAKILAKAKESVKLEKLMDAIDSGEYVHVGKVSFMDRLRFFGIAGDTERVLEVFNEYKLQNKIFEKIKKRNEGEDASLDNDEEASLKDGENKDGDVCMYNGKRKKVSTEGYNIVMSVMVKEGKDLKAVEMFKEMVSLGGIPNAKSFTIVIEHLVKRGMLKEGFEVFEEMPRIRVKRSLKMYEVLVDGFVARGEFEVVKKLVMEMRNDGVLPGYAMREGLMKLKEAGYGEVSEELLRELMPDERVETIGFAVADGSDNEEDVDDGEGKEDEGRNELKDEVKLKPWLDPKALATALSDWREEEVKVMEEAKLVWTTRLVCKFLRSFKKGETAWKFFYWVAYQPGDFTHDVHTASRMIAILVREGNVDLVDQLLSKVKREGILLSFTTIRLIVGFYECSEKPDAALRVCSEMELLCGMVSKFNQLLVYSLLFRTLVRCKRDEDIMILLDKMVETELVPDLQTFTGLMQYFASIGDLRKVQKLFGIASKNGIEADAYMYRTLIHTFCKQAQPILALRVFEDMMNSNLIPDLPTKTLLVRSLWNDGKLREAASVEEMIEEIDEELPDVVPYHVWTVSTDNLTKVCTIYVNSFAADDG